MSRLIRAATRAPRAAGSENASHVLLYAPKATALKSLTDAIALILEDRRKDDLRGVPAAAIREKVVVG